MEICVTKVWTHQSWKNHRTECAIVKISSVWQVSEWMKDKERQNSVTLAVAAVWYSRLMILYT